MQEVSVCLFTFRAHDARTMPTLTTDQCGAFHVHNIHFCACDARTTLALTTDKYGAFRVYNVNFHPHDAHTMLASTTDQCGAPSGSSQSFFCL